MKKILLALSAISLLSSNAMAFDSLSMVSPDTYAKNTFNLDILYNSDVYQADLEDYKRSAWGIKGGVKLPITTRSYKDYEFYWRWQLKYENLTSKIRTKIEYDDQGLPIGGNTELSGDTNVLDLNVYLGHSVNFTKFFVTGEVGIGYDYEFRSSGDVEEIASEFDIDTLSMPGASANIGIVFPLTRYWEVGYQFGATAYYEESLEHSLLARYDNDIMFSYRSSNEFHYNYGIKMFKYSNSPAYNGQITIGCNWAWLD